MVRDPESWQLHDEPVVAIEVLEVVNEVLTMAREHDKTYHFVVYICAMTLDSTDLTLAKVRPRLSITTT